MFYHHLQGLSCLPSIFKCLLRVNHDRKQIRAEDYTWKISPMQSLCMTSSFRFASLYNAHFAGITINHILKAQDDMFSLLAIPLAQATSPSNFFLRLNGFFRKSLRPLLAKFPAFGREIEYVRKEG